MLKLLISNAFTLLYRAWTMLQITHFCGVKFLAWKSRSINFLTNIMSEWTSGQVSRMPYSLNDNDFEIWCYSAPSEHHKGQLGSPVSNEKSTFSVSWNLEPPCEWQMTDDRWQMTKQVRSNPSWVLEARSETLRTPQNVPAPTVSWSDDPV